MRARSLKTQRRYRTQRIPLVKKLLAEHPICQRPGCLADAVDVHELLSRGRGGSITDEANCVTLCRPCHDWVTTHPAEAEAAGLSLKSGAAERREREARG